jgi:hypothetical protein
MENTGFSSASSSLPSSDDGFRTQNKISPRNNQRISPRNSQQASSQGAKGQNTNRKYKPPQKQQPSKYAAGELAHRHSTANFAIEREFVIDMVSKRGGKILEIYATHNNNHGVSEKGPIEMPQQLTDVMSLKIQCVCNHEWVSRLNEISFWCPMCCLTKSGVYVIDDRAVQNPFTSSISLKCKKFGHRVTENSRKTKNYDTLVCKSCTLLAHARKCLGDEGLLLDTKCVNETSQSILRFQCNKLVHHHLCGDEKCVLARARNNKPSAHAINCDNLLVCGNEFYATPAQLKAVDGHVYDCNSGHKPPLLQAGLPNAMIVFETIFETRFDDVLEDSRIYFSLLNYEHHIAVTCRADLRATHNELIATKWCHDNKFAYIVIDDGIRRASQVREYIILQLHQLGLLPFASVEEANEVIADKIHKTNDNYSYPHRCEF